MTCQYCGELMSLDESESFWCCYDCSERVMTPEYAAEVEYQYAIYKGAKLAGLIRDPDEYDEDLWR